MVAMSGKGQYPSITASDLAEIEIPLPPLEIQQQIVAEIEGYEVEITNYKLKITEKQNQIKSVIDKVWGINENK